MRPAVRAAKPASRSPPGFVGAEAARPVRHLSAARRVEDNHAMTQDTDAEPVRHELTGPPRRDPVRREMPSIVTCARFDAQERPARPALYARILVHG